jgi:glyoxylase-like metal-dependent hydrolase (beta-lactamase superfamily II)
MVYPTIRTLERLRSHRTVDDVLAACSEHDEPLWTSCPRAGWLAGKEARYMEHEPPFGELALVCPDGQLLHSLDWQSDHPVGLLRNVQRLTAPNPGVMTGPGTNSYLVGDPSTGHIVIDPGPEDASHLERLWRAAGGDIRAIVCTHSHPDHSPGAPVLQAMCTKHGRPSPPILGLSSRATARSHSHFVAERELQHDERLVLKGTDMNSAPATHTLRVLHTPGHAANHVCLVLEEDGLLFSGDHILNGSTTVIDPPDGNMDAYLRSLDLLLEACAAHGVNFILPAHGYVLGNAQDAIAQLKAHRLKREQKVLDAFARKNPATLDELLPLVYDDVSEKLHAVARRSLHAHLLKLERDCRVRASGESWRRTD